jgi:hypothetical protein
MCYSKCLQDPQAWKHGGVHFFVLSATSAQQTGKEFTLTVYRRFPVNDDYTDAPGGQTLKEAYASFFFSSS